MTSITDHHTIYSVIWISTFGTLPQQIHHKQGWLRCIYAADDYICIWNLYIYMYKKLQYFMQWYDINRNPSLIHLILIYFYVNNFSTEFSVSWLRYLFWNCPRWISLDLIYDSILLQVMTWCHQATYHYQNQCWPSSMLPYGVTRPQWANAVSYTLSLSNHWSHWDIMILNLSFPNTF